jgi:methyltransferase (TIGR00027 family)
MRKGKPSRTACKVALNIVTLGAKLGMDGILPPGIVEATERMLLASGAATERVVRWSRSQRMVAVYEWLDWMLPGQFEAFAYRKAFCEHQVRDGIAAGASQVLLLGAGYDTLAWRLAPEFTTVNFFEIDHPATASLKARGVAAMGTRSNLTLMAEVLGQRKLVDVLKSNEVWDQTKQTVVIAEGLVMYLSAEAVRDLFHQCNTVTGSGSRVAFTYLSTGEDGRPDAGRWTGLMLWLLKAQGEPWLWSIRPKELSGFLAGSGWTDAPDLAGTTDRHGVEYFGVVTK